VNDDIIADNDDAEDNISNVSEEDDTPLDIKVIVIWNVFFIVFFLSDIWKASFNFKSYGTQAAITNA